MGFYLKKAINLGPLRLNFSKSGLGISIGVKGCRISSGPNGNYLNAGRKGLYFKQKLSEGRGSVLSWWWVVIVIAVSSIYYIAVNDSFSGLKDLVFKALVY